MATLTATRRMTAKFSALFPRTRLRSSPAITFSRWCSSFSEFIFSGAIEVADGQQQAAPLLPVRPAKLLFAQFELVRRATGLGTLRHSRNCSPHKLRVAQVVRSLATILSNCDRSSGRGSVELPPRQAAPAPPPSKSATVCRSPARNLKKCRRLSSSKTHFPASAMRYPAPYSAIHAKTWGNSGTYLKWRTCDLAQTVKNCLFGNPEL